MPEYLNVDRQGDPIPVPVSDRLVLPGNWVTVVFDHDISDSAGHHSSSDLASVCNGPRFCHGSLDLWLADFASGTEIQIRQHEVDTTGDRAETHLPHEFNTSSVPVPTDGNGDPLYPRTTHHRYPVISYVNSGHRLRFELSQWPADLSAPVGHIVKAQFVANMWT